MLYVDRFGVELEGGWQSRPENYHTDGSVSRSLGNITGESVSPAYKRFSTMENYIIQNYPVNVDVTCGYHIHVSLMQPGYYGRLMSPEFVQNTLNFWESWAIRENVSRSHRFWQRFRGDNEFCKIPGIGSDSLPAIPFETQSFAQSKVRERYYFLNYCHNLHKTVELRLLPAWKQSTMAVKSLRDWLEFIEGFLSRPGNGAFSQVLTWDDSAATNSEPENIVENITISLDGEVAGGESSIDSPPFSVGDEVVANGTMDGRDFDNCPGIVRGVEPRLDEEGNQTGWELYCEWNPGTRDNFTWYSWDNDVNCIQRRA